MRAGYGLKPKKMSDTMMAWKGTSAKSVLAAEWQYTVSLAPSLTSGVINTCGYKTKSCAGKEGRNCVLMSGRAAMVVDKRAALTRLFAEYPREALELLHWDLQRAQKRHGMTGWFLRPNTASDLDWVRLAPWIFPMVPFALDYTKNPRLPVLPANYYVAFSASERTSNAQLVAMVDSGTPVAFVTDAPGDKYGHLKVLPSDTFLGRPVLNGDVSDEMVVKARLMGGAFIALGAKGLLRGVVGEVDRSFVKKWVS